MWEKLNWIFYKQLIPLNRFECSNLDAEIRLNDTDIVTLRFAAALNIFCDNLWSFDRMEIQNLIPFTLNRAHRKDDFEIYLYSYALHSLLKEFV